MNMLKNSSSSLLPIVVLAAVVSVFHKGGQFLTDRLSALPVKETPSTPMNEGIADTKDFYPVWVKQQVALNAEKQMAAENETVITDNVEVLFADRDALRARKEAAPVDYGNLVRQSVSVHAVSDNGAVLNGTFYAIGAPLTEIALTRPDGTQVVPVLASVKKGQVGIRVDKTIVTVNLIPTA